MSADDALLRAVAEAVRNCCVTLAVMHRDATLSIMAGKVGDVDLDAIIARVKAQHAPTEQPVTGAATQMPYLLTADAECIAAAERRGRIAGLEQAAEIAGYLSCPDRPGATLVWHKIRAARAALEVKP